MPYDPSSILVATHHKECNTMLQSLVTRFFPKTQIFSADNGKDALEQIILRSPLIVLCDIDLPALSGRELCKEIRETESLRDLYLVMLVEHDNKAQKVKALENQADDFLGQPPEPDEVLSKLRAATRITRLHNEVRDERRKLQHLSENVRTTLDELLEVAMGMIHVRQPDSREMLQRVAAATVWMAMAFEDLNDIQIENARIAASLCTIGKMYLPDALINQPVSLDGKATSELMYQVPVYAMRLLQPSRRLERVAAIIHHLYENYDGSGFPDRLQKVEIPIESRIIRPAIDYEMYCTYAKMKPLAALERVKAGAKQYYDPRFTTLLDEYLWSMSPEKLIHNVKAIQIYDLEDGMTVARDMVANSGLKLVSAGTKLTARTIERLLMHSSSDPIIGAVYILQD